jgi:hypothetical protein
MLWAAFLYGRATSIGSTKAGSCYTPDSHTIVALVFVCTELQANGAAARACTALVEPIPVRVQAILDMLTIDGCLKMHSELLGLFPGCYFQGKQFYISLV